MTYIVNDKCINCRHTDCVEVCPVDCFYLGENTIVIHPDECIDCGVCEPECPVDAIQADTDPGADEWLEYNREMSEIWPNITMKLILYLIMKNILTKKVNFKNMVQKNLEIYRTSKMIDL